MIVGQDVASYQGDVNFDVYKNNTNFLFIKASEGVGFTDPKFSRNQSEARRVGIPLGFYHFARPDLGNSPEAECDWFLKVCNGPHAGEVMALDYECANQKQADVDWCKKFLDRLQAKIGVKAFIYLNQSQLKTFNWKSIVDGGYPLWVAAYTFDPNNNNFYTGAWSYAAMQQWTSSQKVPGIPTNCDGDAFFGDVATFKKYGVPPVIPPLPPTSDCDTKLIAANLKIKQLEADKNELDTQKNKIEAKYTTLRDGILKVCHDNNISVS